VPFSCRFNKDGEVYAEAYSLLTFNGEGKIISVEAFSDPDVGMAALSSK
jgi:ketosteroid isomerase-like protein